MESDGDEDVIESLDLNLSLGNNLPHSQEMPGSRNQFISSIARSPPQTSQDHDYCPLTPSYGPTSLISEITLVEQQTLDSEFLNGAQNLHTARDSPEVVVPNDDDVYQSLYDQQVQEENTHIPYIPSSPNYNPATLPLQYEFDREAMLWVPIFRNNSPRREPFQNSSTEDVVLGDDIEDEGTKDGRNCYENFNCNVCLGAAKEPVVTSCGHLFCWSCLYRWLHYHCEYKECPVCKGEVRESNIIPIYGRGDDYVEEKMSDERVSGLKIPPRPRARRINSSRPWMHSTILQRYSEMVD